MLFLVFVHRSARLVYKYNVVLKIQLMVLDSLYVVGLSCGTVFLGPSFGTVFQDCLGTVLGHWEIRFQQYDSGSRLW